LPQIGRVCISNSKQALHLRLRLFEASMDQVSNKSSSQ
jgi:hypothetical protein